MIRSFLLFIIMPVIVLILMFYIIPWIDTMDTNWYKALLDTTCYGKYGEHDCKDISTISLMDGVLVRIYEGFKFLVFIFAMTGTILFFGKLIDRKQIGSTQEKRNRKQRKPNIWTLKSEFGIHENNHEKMNSDIDKKDSEESEDIGLREFTGRNIL